MAANAVSYAQVVQGTPDGYGAPVQVTIVGADGDGSPIPASSGAKASSGSLSIVNSFLTCAAGGDGSVAAVAENIAVANTVQVVEFFNLSANVIWASWVGTAVANTAGSFPIPPLASNVAGFYSSPPGASGTLSIIAPAGASAFTCNLWS
jgi:hypothetical protein